MRRPIQGEVITGYTQEISAKNGIDTVSDNQIVTAGSGELARQAPNIPKPSMRFLSKKEWRPYHSNKGAELKSVGYIKKV